MIPPELVEAIRVNAPLAERDNKVEVEGSKETAAEELLKRSRPAKAPTRPTVPMRSKSTRGESARATLRKARRARRNQGGYRGDVVIVVDGRGLTYERKKEGKKERKRKERDSKR